MPDLQALFNSGLAFVAVPPGRYEYGAPLTIGPADGVSVRRVDFQGAVLVPTTPGAALRVTTPHVVLNNLFIDTTGTAFAPDVALSIEAADCTLNDPFIFLPQGMVAVDVGNNTVFRIKGGNLYGYSGLPKIAGSVGVRLGAGANEAHISTTIHHFEGGVLLTSGHDDLMLDGSNIENCPLYGVRFAPSAVDELWTPGFLSCHFEGCGTIFDLGENARVIGGYMLGCRFGSAPPGETPMRIINSAGGIQSFSVRACVWSGSPPAGSVFFTLGGVQAWGVEYAFCTMPAGATLATGNYGSSAISIQADSPNGRTLVITAPNIRLVHSALGLYGNTPVSRQVVSESQEGVPALEEAVNGLHLLGALQDTYGA